MRPRLLLPALLALLASSTACTPDETSGVSVVAPGRFAGASTLIAQGGSFTFTVTCDEGILAPVTATSSDRTVLAIVDVGQLVAENRATVTVKGIGEGPATLSFFVAGQDLMSLPIEVHPATQVEIVQPSDGVRFPSTLAMPDVIRVDAGSRLPLVVRLLDRDGAQLAGRGVLQVSAVPVAPTPEPAASPVGVEAEENNDRLVLLGTKPGTFELGLALHGRAAGTFGYQAVAADAAVDIGLTQADEDMPPEEGDVVCVGAAPTDEDGERIYAARATWTIDGKELKDAAGAYLCYQFSTDSKYQHTIAASYGGVDDSLRLRGRNFKVRAFIPLPTSRGVAL